MQTRAPMSGAIRRSRRVRRALAVVAVGLVLALNPLSASPAAAHDPTNCFHGHQTEGSWHAHFVDHFPVGGNHYNRYDHYLFVNGVHQYQHTRDVLCGS